MKYIVRLMLSVMSMFSMGCVGENNSLKEDYFVGTWQSEGNAKIVLNKNGKGELFNFNRILLDAENLPDAISSQAVSLIPAL